MAERLGFVVYQFRLVFAFEKWETRHNDLDS
jgi:hypothetical protein